MSDSVSAYASASSSKESDTSSSGGSSSVSPPLPVESDTSSSGGSSSVSASASSSSNKRVQQVFKIARDGSCDIGIVDIVTWFDERQVM